MNYIEDAKQEGRHKGMALQAGHWYVWAGPPGRPAGWVPKMDFLMDGKPHYCVWAQDVRAKFGTLDDVVWYFASEVEWFHDLGMMDPRLASTQEFPMLVFDPCKWQASIHDMEKAAEKYEAEPIRRRTIIPFPELVTWGVSPLLANLPPLDSANFAEAVSRAMRQPMKDRLRELKRKQDVVLHKMISAR